jgi:hypothetical protein
MVTILGKFKTGNSVFYNYLRSVKDKYSRLLNLFVWSPFNVLKGLLEMLICFNFGKFNVGN